MAKPASRPNQLAIVVEDDSGSFLKNAIDRHLGNLNQRSDLLLPQLVTAEESAVTAAARKITVVPANAEREGLHVLLARIDQLKRSGDAVIVAQQRLGNEGLDGGALLRLAIGGADALVDEYEMVRDDAVLHQAVRWIANGASGAKLVGQPVKPFKDLVTEVTQTWQEDEWVVAEPRFAFRVACALTGVQTIPKTEKSNQDVADYLIDGDYFHYNAQDTRKAVGALAKVWGLGKPTLYQLPGVARSRGFPPRDHADAVFDVFDSWEFRDDPSFTSGSGLTFSTYYAGPGRTA